MSKNLISIITPTYNRAANFLPQTINCIQHQKTTGFTYEHIIVDNASSDDTAKVVKEFAKKDKRIKYIRNKTNLGAAGALNIGLKMAKGDIVMPVDDDDLLPMSSLQFRFDFFKKNPKVKWAYGYLIFIDMDNRLLDRWVEYNRGYKKEKSVLLSLLRQNFIPGGTVTYKRAALKKVGGWTEGIKTQDYDMSLKMAAQKFVPYEMQSYLYFYRLHPGQFSKIQKNDGTYTNERSYYLNKYAKQLKGTDIK